jgi:hypothetical protein
MILALITCFVLGYATGQVSRVKTYQREPTTQTIERDTRSFPEDETK